MTLNIALETLTADKLFQHFQQRSTILILSLTHTNKTKQNQKTEVCLYTNDKESEREIRETTPFTLTSNNIKYLKVTLTYKIGKTYTNCTSNGGLIYEACKELKTT